MADYNMQLLVNIWHHVSCNAFYLVQLRLLSGNVS